MIRNLLQFIKRLQYVTEENKPRTIEFNNDNYQDLLNVQISVVFIDGQECEVVLYDENGNRYRSDYRTGITIENLYKICPVIKQSFFVCCKWENGKSLPDASVMLELCALLGITVNDLLCGEVVSMGNYDEKVEKTLLEIVRQKEKADKCLYE